MLFLQGISNFLCLFDPAYSRWWALSEAEVHASSSSRAVIREAMVQTPEQSHDQPEAVSTKEVEDTSFPREYHW
jgi:hypothetical protein